MTDLDIIRAALVGGSAWHPTSESLAAMERVEKRIAELEREERRAAALTFVINKGMVVSNQDTERK